MTVDKTSEEWVVMRFFREKCKIFPAGKLVKSESPDFILKVNRKKQIGIELTRFDYLINDGSNRDEILKQLETHMSGNILFFITTNLQKI